MKTVLITGAISDIRRANARFLAKNKFICRRREDRLADLQDEFREVRFKGDRERAESVYKGFEPLKVEDIADIIAFVITRPYHVNIADLLVLPTAQASATIVNKTI